MQKVIVIGCPGSGKSTFSRKLHDMMGIPLFHLDMLNWNADKTPVAKSIFYERLSHVMEHREWIIDGNYGSTMELRMLKLQIVKALHEVISGVIRGAIAFHNVKIISPTRKR